MKSLVAKVMGYKEGQRSHCWRDLPNVYPPMPVKNGFPSQDGGYLDADGRCSCHGYKATGGWRFW